MSRMTSFVADEDGAITIEWVALAAGAVLLAAGLTVSLEQAVDESAVSIGDSLGAWIDGLYADEDEG